MSDPVEPPEEPRNWFAQAMKRQVEAPSESRPKMDEIRSHADDDDDFESWASEADWKARCEMAEAALRGAMVLLGDADDAYTENLLEALFDSDSGFALDFYNRVVAGQNDADVTSAAPVIATAEVRRRV